MQQKLKIGEQLLRENLITQSQLDEAIEQQKKSGGRIGDILIGKNYISENAVLEVLSRQLNIPLIDLNTYPLSLAESARLPENYARQFQCVLLKTEPNQALVGMTDPLDIMAYDEVSRILKKPLDIALIKKRDFEHALSRIYRRAEQITGYAGELGKSLETDEERRTESTAVPAQVIDAPVRKFIQALFEDAVQVHASDIHIEPDKDLLRIRLRVDGYLQEQILENTDIGAAVSQRLKLMAKINMAEKRLPLDGRFSIEIGNKQLDVRLSTMPNEYGESIVMRLLDQSSTRVTLEKSGMPKDVLERFRRIIQIPRGMILVTGPTGSGKTTTLYGALDELNSPDTKIITIEDPVEYRMPRICQVQVKPSIGLDFALVLRSILRQDPDIVLVGEMRDQETASIAMRAALTGHLVFSTVHTNDTPSTAVRLLDMGVPGYLIAATLQCIIAQRLIRRICENCKGKYEPTPQETQWLTKFVDAEHIPKEFYIGKGCTLCNRMGYKGRIGIFEFLLFDNDMITALAHSDQELFMKLAHHYLKGKSLLDQAVEQVKLGVSTIHEAMAVAGGVV